MGVRACHEEAYTVQTRGMFLAGLYHRAGSGEINELVNIPDVIGVDITLNGEIFFAFERNDRALASGNRLCQR